MSGAEDAGIVGVNGEERWSLVRRAAAVTGIGHDRGAVLGTERRQLASEFVDLGIQDQYMKIIIIILSIAGRTHHCFLLLLEFQMQLCRRHWTRMADGNLRVGRGHYARPCRMERVGRRWHVGGMGRTTRTSGRHDLRRGRNR